MSMAHCGFWDWWGFPASAGGTLGWSIIGDVVVMDGGAGAMLVAPDAEEVVAGDESDQQRLGDAAVGEAILGVAEVEVVSLESAVEVLGHGTSTL
ncbi:hypothetical protein OIE66_01100 [Nonomuraea sp. NBC_01738]|uniref:hypothetical protein n=1 Tax=Nonomuraea sp. NBC_01738 TaxID=2976003 RepID=UPI002E12C498|nr:hypothetical protein OIE66_01100 [Nonomuraea sp. NBC_01738]